MILAVLPRTLLDLAMLGLSLFCPSNSEALTTGADLRRGREFLKPVGLGVGGIYPFPLTPRKSWGVGGAKDKAKIEG